MDPKREVFTLIEATAPWRLMAIWWAEPSFRSVSIRTILFDPSPPPVSYLRRRDPLTSSRERKSPR